MSPSVRMPDKWLLREQIVASSSFVSSEAMTLEIGDKSGVTTVNGTSVGFVAVIVYIMLTPSSIVSGLRWWWCVVEDSSRKGSVMAVEGWVLQLEGRVGCALKDIGRKEISMMMVSGQLLCVICKNSVIMLLLNEVGSNSDMWLVFKVGIILVHSCGDVHHWHHCLHWLVQIMSALFDGELEGKIFYVWFYGTVSTMPFGKRLMIFIQLVMPMNPNAIGKIHRKPHSHAMECAVTMAAPYDQKFISHYKLWYSLDTSAYTPDPMLLFVFNGQAPSTVKAKKWVLSRIHMFQKT